MEESRLDDSDKNFPSSLLQLWSRRHAAVTVMATTTAMNKTEPRTEPMMTPT